MKFTITKENKNLKKRRKNRMKPINLNTDLGKQELITQLLLDYIRLQESYHKRFVSKDIQNHIDKVKNLANSFVEGDLEFVFVRGVVK